MLFALFYLKKSIVIVFKSLKYERYDLKGGAKP